MQNTSSGTAAVLSLLLCVVGLMFSASTPAIDPVAINQVAAIQGVNRGYTRPLVVGIFPRRNATQTVTLFKPLLDYVGDQLNLKIKLVTARDFASFWRGVEERRFDLVHFNQYHYVKSHAKNGYDAILSNEEQGESEMAGAIYARRDSGMDTLADLKGRTIIFGGGRSAMMSYIVPTDLLRSAGLKQGDYTEKFAVSPPNSVYAVYFRQADAAGAGEVVQRLPSVEKRIDIKQLKTLAVSQPLPQLVWAVRREMDDEFRKKLVQIMTTLEDSVEGEKLLKKAKLTGLHSITDADYQGVREIVDKILGERY